MSVKPSILVLEDERALGLLYREELEKDGYRVTTVPDVATAFQALERSSFDLIISDIRLPGPSGLDFIRGVMERWKHIPVIINSAYQSYQSDFSSWAADAYVVKSGSLDELKAKVRELLGRTHVTT